MLTEVIEPTAHKYIVTIRGFSLEEINKIESKFVMTPIKTTTEYCIIDTNEKLDYVHI